MRLAEQPGGPFHRAGSAQSRERAGGRLPGSEGGASPAEAQGDPVCVFRWTGRDWQVVFDGSQPFYLEDTLAAKYLDYLLHQANQPISAFDLEVVVTPEKGQARAKDSFQPKSDDEAKRAYREDLGRKQAERKQARKAGDRRTVRALDGEIKKLRAALKGHGGMADTGERARNNIRHAIDGVKAQLGKGGRAKQAFREHLDLRLSIGLECLYSDPEGRKWA